MLDLSDDADMVVIDALAVYISDGRDADATISIADDLAALIRKGRLTVDVRARLDPDTLADDRKVVVTRTDGTELHAPLDALGPPDDMFEF